MRERLDRFVRDRTAMLAAVSHDLRTPITSLRLHAEFVEDERTRAKIVATLDDRSPRGHVLHHNVSIQLEMFESITRAALYR